MNRLDTACLPYRVGGLLYMPAFQQGLAAKIESGAMPCLTSVALCLEDSIRDDALVEAEAALCDTLRQLCALPGERLPLVFIRVRSPEHLLRVFDRVLPSEAVVTGFILPKFDLSNLSAYDRAIREVNAGRAAPKYIMPILESRAVAAAASRARTLEEIRDALADIRPWTLNVRVGGNDLSHLYGLRRAVDQNIYQIGVVRDILVDILNVFAPEYVVSGPVWEYFGSDPDAPWARGLRAELALDRLNGFVGKTAIHPSQLPLIYESMQPTRADYEDAGRVLGWRSGTLGVEKSADGSRMNEEKTHSRWAERVRVLGDLYGTREEGR